MAVLGVIMAMVGQLVSSATQAIGNSGKLLNCDDQARLVFGRMSGDFSRMLKRNDVDVIFAKQTGSSSAGANDSIFFVTQSVGSNSNTSWYNTSSSNLVTLAGYCIAPDPQGSPINSSVGTNLYDFVRLGHALTWDQGNSSPDNLVFVSFAPATGSLISATTLDGHWGSTAGTPTLGSSPTYTPPYTPPATGPNVADYHALADQIFRFEYCFLLKDGSYSNAPVITSNGLRYNTAGQGPPASSNDSSDTTTGTTGSLSSQYGAGSRWFDTKGGRAFVCVNATAGNAVWAPLGVQDVSAIVVGIALLERDSRKMIATTSGATAYNTTLPGLFADSSPTTSAIYPTTKSPTLMQQAWQTTLDSSSFAASLPAGVPVSSASQIHIYQRYFYLNANNL
jgi:hypothetical protein